MKVGLFVTCLVDLLRPRIGFAAIRLLQAAGCEVVVPASQTGCGQPAWRARAAALGTRTYELSDFLFTVAKPDRLPGDFTGSVTYHDACSGLRELGCMLNIEGRLRRMGDEPTRVLHIAEILAGEP